MVCIIYSIISYRIYDTNWNRRLFLEVLEKMKVIKKDIWKSKKEFLKKLNYTDREIELMKMAIEEGINMQSHEFEEREDGHF